MKKLFAVILSMSMFFTLVSCGGSSSNTSQPTPSSSSTSSSSSVAKAPTAEARALRCAASTSTGSLYGQCAALASVWEQLDFVTNINMETTSGSIENLMLVSEGSDDFGIANGVVCASAPVGAEPYDQVYDNFATICYSATSACQYIVRADSDMYTIEDLVGKVVGTQQAGSGGELESRLILEALGITYSDLGRVDYIGVGEACSQLRDGKIDCAIVHAAYPNASVTELATSSDIRILTFTDEQMETLMSKLSWITNFTIPADTYNGISEDVQVAGLVNVLLVNKDLPTEWVYEMCVSAYDNFDTLISGNATMAQWNWSSEVDKVFPLHPGAVQFYSERNF